MHKLAWRATFEGSDLSYGHYGATVIGTDGKSTADPASSRRGWLSNLTAEQVLLVGFAGSVVAGIIILFIDHDLFTGLTTEAVLGGGVIVLVGAGFLIWSQVLDPLTAMENPCSGYPSLSEALSQARADFVGEIVTAVEMADEEAQSAGRSAFGPLSEETFQDVHTLVIATAISNSLIGKLPAARRVLRRYSFSIIVGIPVLVVVASLTSGLNQDFQTAIGALVFTVLFGALLMLLPMGDDAQGLGQWDARVKELRGLPYPDLKRKISKWAAEEVEGD
jgi:hypothetical protein